MENLTSFWLILKMFNRNTHLSQYVEKNRLFSPGSVKLTRHSTDIKRYKKKKKKTITVLVAFFIVLQFLIKIKKNSIIFIKIKNEKMC